MLCQVVFPRPRHVVSEINPFLLGPGSAACCSVTTEAAVVLGFLDFFPIWSELVSAERLCTKDKMNVMRRIDGEDLCQSINNGK